MTTPTPTPADVTAALAHLANVVNSCAEWEGYGYGEAMQELRKSEGDAALATLRAALNPPTPAEVEAALAVIQDAEGVTWTSGVDTDAIRAALATIRAALKPPAPQPVEVEAAFIGLDLTASHFEFNDNIPVAKEIRRQLATIRAALATRDAKIARLREALLPFASMAEIYEYAGIAALYTDDDLASDSIFSVGTLRQARAALCDADAGKE